MRIKDLPEASTVYSDDVVPLDRSDSGTRKFAVFNWMSSHFYSKSYAIEVEQGGTGADNAADARANLGVASLTNGKVTPTESSSGIISVMVSRDLSLADAGMMLDCASASDVVLTIPAHADIAFPVGTEIEVCRRTDADVEIVGDTGVTVQSTGGLNAIADKYGCVCLKQMAEDVWLLAGGLG